MPSVYRGRKGRQNECETGLSHADFYQHLDEYEDDFLEDHGYSREEILEGLEGLAQESGLTELE